MNQYLECEYCVKQNSIKESSEVIQIGSNFKKFRHENYTIWRCKNCQTIHARDKVDLDYYYKFVTVQ